MRIAVIGAGIVGVTTAYELAADGHEVVVYDRRPGVAAEASYATGGVLGAASVAPWPAAGTRMAWVRHMFGRHTFGRHVQRPHAATRHDAQRARLHRLGAYSRARQHVLTTSLQIDCEQTQGVLVLMRSARDQANAQPVLQMLAGCGAAHAWLDPDACRRVEPGLSQDAELAGGIHLPDGGAGNCRQFAHGMKAQAQRLGVTWRLATDVLAIEPGVPVHLHTRAVAAEDVAPARRVVAPAPVETPAFDAVVLCAALGAVPLMSRLGLRLPTITVRGCSVTAPLRPLEGQPGFGPLSALVDEGRQVTITRLGRRVRVAGSATLGGALERPDSVVVDTLFKVLQEWFPGAAVQSQAQPWKGACVALPDGAPLLGASGVPGVWLNLAHGWSGWTLACGSARVVADGVAARAPAIDSTGLGIDRALAG